MFGALDAGIHWRNTQPIRPESPAVCGGRHVGVLEIGNLHLEAAGIADATHGWRRDGNDEGFLDALQLSVKLADDLVGILPAFFTFGKGFERDEDDAGIRGIGERRPAEAGKLHGIADAGHGAGDIAHLFDDGIGTRERGAVR